MTRREEIVTATLGCRQSYVDLKRPTTLDDVADAFEKGAYWADKTIVDKASQWLYDHLATEYHGAVLKIVVKEKGLMSVEFVEKFKKAMEE